MSPSAGDRRRLAWAGAVAALLAWGSTAIACGAAGHPRRLNVAPPRGPEDPLPTEANRNAPPPPIPAAEVEETPRHVLWCSRPAGSACTAAQQELGQPPTPSPAVPPELLSGARDLQDDCSDPDLAPLMQRITTAVGAASSGWTDQEGQILDPTLLSDLYAGSGCTNAARAGDPPIKIHVVDIGAEAHFLVRVWEIGEI